MKDFEYRKNKEIVERKIKGKGTLIIKVEEFLDELEKEGLIVKKWKNKKVE